jgi:hypothetical protein
MGAGVGAETAGGMKNLPTNYRCTQSNVKKEKSIDSFMGMN